MSYAFCERFPEELAAEIFAHILNKALNEHMVDPIAVFVDGEFWHGKDRDERVARLRRNREYWTQKIDENIARDRKNDLLLRQAGVDVSTDVYTVQQAAERLLPLLGGDAPC